jgi:hypothetical protein
MGAVLLAVCVWLGVLTFEQGGIRQVSRDGDAEVLTMQGWQPMDPGQAFLQPTIPPPSTIMPLPTELPMVPPSPAHPEPTVTPLPTVHLTANAVKAVSPDSNGSDAAYSPGPTKLDSDISQFRQISPWEVLGWLLVGLVPAGGLLAAGLVVYRQVALIRAQVAAFSPPGQGGVALEVPSDNSQVEEMAAADLQMDVTAYLSGEVPDVQSGVTHENLARWPTQD